MTAAAWTPPPCNPATLGALCKGGCGRRLHHQRRAGHKRPCTLGHPTHGGNGRCPGCYSRQRRANTPTTATAPAAAAGVDLTWQQDAACAGAWPELFFPDIRAGQNARPVVAPVAERYCATCPVRAACDKWAEQTRSVGLWGGVWRRYRGTSYTRTRILRGAA